MCSWGHTPVAVGNGLVRSGVGGQELRADRRVWERWLPWGVMYWGLLGGVRYWGQKGDDVCRVLTGGIRSVGYGGLTWGGDVYGGVGRGGWRSELTGGHGRGRCSLSWGGRWAVGIVP